MAEVRRHAAIMFTDIVGYTALMGADEDKAFEMLRKNREIHNKFIAQFNGTLIKEMGDGMLISFDLASDAVRCAIEIQKACKAQNIPLKIGIHEGEMVFEGNDVLGDGVNIASRIQDGAEEGCIIISGSVYHDIKNKADIHVEFVAEKHFKNVDENIRIYQVNCGVEGISNDKNQIINHIQNKKSKRQKMVFVIFGFLVIIIIAALIWVNKGKSYLPLPAALEGKEKSIAVRPFWNESTNEENEAFVNGVAEDIRNALSKIADLRVPSRGSVEKYKDHQFTTSNIAEDLGVTYILEGTVQRIGNFVKIHVQLIEPGENEDHIWQETYEEDLSELSKIFSIQSQIAQRVAHEIEVVILPEAQQRLQNIPTENLDAYTFYLQARQHLVDYWKGAMNFMGTSLYSPDTSALDKAIVDFKRALAHDEHFADSYSGLALTYWYRYSGDQQQNSVFIDSVDLLVNRALELNKNLEEGYFVRGLYERNVLTDYQKAAESYQKAISLNPNYTLAFLELGSLYIWEFNDYIEGLDLLHKIETLDRGYRLSFILNQIGHGYLGAGLTDVAREYFSKSLEYNSDTILFYSNMAFAEWSQGNIQKAIDWQLLSYAIDSTIWSTNIFLATRYSFLKDFENAFKYLQNIKVDGEFPYLRVSNHRIGYILCYNGLRDEAEKYIQLQIETCKDAIEKNSPYSFQKRAQYDLAACYAFQQDYEKAFALLKAVESRKVHHAWVMAYFKFDPMMDSIREDPRYKEFWDVLELNFEMERQKVESWRDERLINNSLSS